MGSVILCRTKLANKPYVIRGLQLKIYSLEELCYYIYHHIDLIGTDLINEELTTFIRNEIEEPDLADRLEEVIHHNGSLAQMVILLLKYVDYYSDQEISDIEELLASLNTQNTNERLKARADSFLENERYYQAIFHYEKILRSPPDPHLTGAFYARVYHNLGVSYARMFYYTQAAAYFELAYKIGQHEESKELWLVAQQMAKADSQIEREPDNQEEALIRKKLDVLRDNARYSDEFRQLQQIVKHKENGAVNQYDAQIDELIEQWKNEYIKYTSL